MKISFIYCKRSNKFNVQTAFLETVKLAKIDLDVKVCCGFLVT